jgi:CRP-like cAMP-binding protein
MWHSHTIKNNTSYSRTENENDMFNPIKAWLKSYNIVPTEEDKAIIKKHTHQISIPKNTIIMKQGRPVERLYFLNSGIVRLYRVQDEIDQTIDFVSWKEFVSTAVYVFNQRISPCALETLTPVEGFCWEREDLFVIKEQTSCGAKIEEALLDRLLNWTQDREIDIMSLTPEERYIKLLDAQPSVVQGVPLKIIASYLGIHQDSLSRIRKKYSRR